MTAPGRKLNVRFEMETVESCPSLGIVLADLFRPSRPLRSGRHVPEADLWPEPDLPSYRLGVRIGLYRAWILVTCITMGA
jgi:hypothetical protein